MKITAKQVAERFDVSYVVASGLMTLLVKMGQAKIAEKIFHESGKGKPTRVYEVDDNVRLNFDAPVVQSVATDEAA